MIGTNTLEIMNKKLKYTLICTALLGLTACSKDVVDNEIEEPDNKVIQEVEEPDNTDDEQQNTSAYASIDWNSFEELMSQEDKEDFEEFKPVLENEETFYCFEWGDQDYSFDDYLSTIESGDVPAIEELVLVDLDGQNGKELVINIYEGGGNYLILTRDSGKIFGTSVGARSFEELQKDGKFLASGGASDLYFSTMKIDGSGVETTIFGEVHSEENESGEYVEKLEINGEVINDSLQNWMDKNYSDPAEWIAGL